MNRRNFLQTSGLLAAGGVIPYAEWVRMLLPASGTYTVVRRNVGMYVNKVPGAPEFQGAGIERVLNAAWAELGG